VGRRQGRGVWLLAFSGSHLINVLFGRVCCPIQLWNLYLDLEESLGTIETTKAAYDRALDIKVGTTACAGGGAESGPANGQNSFLPPLSKSMLPLACAGSPETESQPPPPTHVVCCHLTRWRRR
jgi:hypothetical protein